MLVVVGTILAKGIVIPGIISKSEFSSDIVYLKWFSVDTKRSDFWTAEENSSSKAYERALREKMDENDYS